MLLKSHSFESDRSHNITQFVHIIFTNAQISLSFIIMITIDMLSVTGIYMVKHMIYLYFFLFIEQFNPLLFYIIFSYREKFILYKNNKVVLKAYV